ncbi:hypothetical protein ASF73_08965 [Xanthomonas sp. Leaf131]|nr:hypothetical protein ASF73_08965 [Xanthomonas sp. Leaf131]
MLGHSDRTATRGWIDRLPYREQIDRSTAQPEGPRCAAVGNLNWPVSPARPSVASAKSMSIGSIGSPMTPACGKYGSGSARGEANG